MSAPTRLIPALALAGLLAACAAPSSAPGGAAANTASGQQAARPADDKDAYVTGSRLKRTTHEQLVNKTGAAGAREMDRNRPPEAGPRSN